MRIIPGDFRKVEISCRSRPFIAINVLKIIPFLTSFASIAEFLSQVVQREASTRSLFVGPDGIIAENPSWLEMNLREPQRIPAKRKGIISNLGGGFLLLVLVVASPCLFISLLRTLIPSLSL